MTEIVEEILEGVKLINRSFHADERGFFVEGYRRPLYREFGIEDDFVQDNHSFSKKGVVRGMHFQSSPGQAKLIFVALGTIYDVFVDIRKESKNFGKWGARVLDSSKGQQLYLPAGFAHGFAVLSESAHVLYKVSSVFNPKTERTFRFDDPEVGIEWPISEPILSEKDRGALTLKEVLCESVDSRI